MAHKLGEALPNPNQIDAYINNDSFWFQELADDQKYYKHVNQAYLTYAQSMGFIKEAKPVFHQLYSEQLQKFRLAAQGHGEQQPPLNKRERIETHFDPLPFWYATFEDQLNSKEEYPLHAVTQRPAAMYHSWGSQNGLAPSIARV